MIDAPRLEPGSPEATAAATTCSTSAVVTFLLFRLLRLLLLRRLKFCFATSTRAIIQALFAASSQAEEFVNPLTNRGLPQQGACFSSGLLQRRHMVRLASAPWEFRLGRDPPLHVKSTASTEQVQGEVARAQHLGLPRISSRVPHRRPRSPNSRQGIP